MEIHTESFTASLAFLERGGGASVKMVVRRGSSAGGSKARICLLYELIKMMRCNRIPLPLAFVSMSMTA